MKKTRSDASQRFQKKLPGALRREKDLFADFDSSAEIGHGSGDAVGCKGDADDVSSVRVQGQLFARTAVAEFRSSAGNEEAAPEEIAHDTGHRGVVAIHFTCEFDSREGFVFEQ